MQRQLRADDIVPDDAFAVAAEAAATSRQCKAEAGTADSHRRKAEVAEKFRQVCTHCLAGCASSWMRRWPLRWGNYVSPQYCSDAVAVTLNSDPVAWFHPPNTMPEAIGTTRSVD